jgi:hypothetical protein
MQQINEWKAHSSGNVATLRRINDARWEFANHFAAATPIVRLVRGLGGHLGLELPRHCAYWTESLLTAFIAEHGMYTCLFDGCMYGLTAKYGNDAGQPMLKAWRVVTTATTVRDTITKVCTHHGTCEGTGA